MDNSVQQLLNMRAQVGAGAPQQPYIPPPKPKPQPSYNPFPGGVVPGVTYSGKPGAYSGLYGQGLMASLGLSPAESWIIQHESGGKPDAWNKTPVYSGGAYLGHAFGLGQLVDTNRASYAKQLGIADPNTMDPQQQLAMFRLYVQSRYQTAENAQSFWQAHGWY